MTSYSPLENYDIISNVLSAVGVGAGHVLNDCVLSDTGTAVSRTSRPQSRESHKDFSEGGLEGWQSLPWGSECEH